MYVVVDLFDEFVSRGVLLLRDIAHLFFKEYIPTNLCHSQVSFLMYPSLTSFL